MTDTEQYWIDQYHEVAERLRDVDAFIRDCWEACGGKGPDSSDDELVGTISTMRAGLERLQAQLDAGTETGWHALRNERDALRKRIADAPKRNVYRDDDGDGVVMRTVVSRSLVGKRVALVVIEQ